MLRKYLFLGLTLVLVVALVNLIIRGRRLEKQQASRRVEVVEQSKPTATRVLAPQDLEITQSKMWFEEAAGGRNQSQTARHEIEIRNNGHVAYSRIQLSFEYLDRRGNVSSTKTHPITRTILPGAELKVSDIRIEGLPGSAASSRVAIVYADIGQKG